MFFFNVKPEEFKFGPILLAVYAEIKKTLSNQNISRGIGPNIKVLWLYIQR